jgi:hypothetical protein
MHQTTLNPTFLHVYNVDSESWASMELVSPVSSRMVLAMNLILEQDGIKAFIGTREEFGVFVAELLKETEGGTVRSWTSCPAYTIMSMLGLCLNTTVPGKPEMAFYGSPLTLSLALAFQYLLEGGMPVDIFDRKDGVTFGYLDDSFVYPNPLPFPDSRTYWLSASEIQDGLGRAVLYLEDNNLL